MWQWCELGKRNHVFKVNKVVLGIIFFFVFYCVSTASDVISNISENALNHYAMSVGPIQKKTFRIINLRFPVFAYPDYADNYTSGDLYFPQMKLQLFVGFVYLPLLGDNLHWSIQAPGFEISESGIKFRAIVQAKYLGQHFYRAIVLPAELTHNRGRGTLDLNISEKSVPIEIPFKGSVYKVEQVNVGKYYSTSIPIQGASFSFDLPDNTTRTIHTRISLDRIEYLERNIKIRYNIIVE